MSTANLFARVAPYSCCDGATFSADRRYRYRLWRWLGGSPEHRVVFVGLNPSKANESDDDQTITKCREFARMWGFGSLDMVNLFALVSTDPSALIVADDAVGPENDRSLEDAFRNAHRVVLAWGAHNAKVRALVRSRLTLLNLAEIRTRAEVGTLGFTSDGKTPRHPSRIGYGTRFVTEIRS